MSLPRNAAGPKKAKGASDDTGEEEEEERVGWSVWLAYTKWKREREGGRGEKEQSTRFGAGFNIFRRMHQTNNGLSPKTLFSVRT